jgi:hypothetical protein
MKGNYVVRAQDKRMEHVAQKMALKPSESVREIESQDGAVLLDIRQGLCLSMTPIGMMIWGRLKLNQAPDQIACWLANECPDVPCEKIQDDVVQFVEELKHKGLLVAREEWGQARQSFRLPSLVRTRRVVTVDVSEGRARETRFLLWKALLGLLAFDLFRFGQNFTMIHGYVRSWPVAPWSAPPDVVEQVCRTVNYACVWYPKRVLCLQRSAITTCLLRTYGVSAQMVMGAQKVPFKAHAWTEVEGRAINERTDVHRTFLVWERC